MTQEERQEIFEKLAQLKVKTGETLKTSYFKLGGTEPLFVITEKIDGSLTLYSVIEQSLKRIQSAASVNAPEAFVLPRIKHCVSRCFD